jgi:hypothetical protein
VAGPPPWPAGSVVLNAMRSTLPDNVKPGDTIRCCGRTFRLTFEYGGVRRRRSVEGQHETRGRTTPLLTASHEPADDAT